MRIFTARRVRNLWIIGLILCLDAWLCLLALWLMPEWYDGENVRQISRSLSFIIGLSVFASVIMCLLVLAFLPKGPAQDASVVNLRNCSLIMSSAIGALFLSILHAGLYWVVNSAD